MAQVGLAWPLLGASSHASCTPEGRASGRVAHLPALYLLGVAQPHCHQAVSSSLALQPTVLAIGRAVSHYASALLSRVQVERASLTEGRLHFQPQDSRR